MLFKQKIELGVVYLGMYCAAFTFTVVFPFASEMVMSFGVASDRDSTGFWVGMIATSLMIGRVVSSPIWGHLIDVWGRKIVTQFSLLSMVVLQILFGLCTSLIPSMVVRLLLGLFSPLMISSKTIAAELLKDNISEAMIWITITWNIGSISGSFFGGLLSNPNERGLTSWSFFDTFPFFLCCALPAFICFATFILGTCYLRETLVKHEKGSLLAPNIRSMKEILFDSKIFPICAVYVIISFHFTAFQELLTLYCWAERKSGGLELTSRQIGFLLGFSNFCLLFVQRYLFLLLKARLGVMKIARVFLFVLPFLSISVPIASLMPNENLALVYLMVIYLCWYFSDFAVCTAVLVLINHSVPTHELGKINGMTMSLNCFVRAFAPITIGTLFACTIRNDSLPQPINYSVCFYFLLVIEFIGFYYTLKIHVSAEQPYKEPESEIPLVEIAED
jgi:MFS family permease